MWNRNRTHQNQRTTLRPIGPQNPFWGFRLRSKHKLVHRIQKLHFLCSSRQLDIDLKFKGKIKTFKPNAQNETPYFDRGTLFLPSGPRYDHKLQTEFFYQSWAIQPNSKPVVVFVLLHTQSRTTTIPGLIESALGSIETFIKLNEGSQENNYDY